MILAAPGHPPGDHAPLQPLVRLLLRVRKVSQPVPLETLKARIDHLAKLRSVFVVLTGGESLLHPDAIELVRYAREQGMTPFLNTNGYLLTKKIIEGLNEAGLYGLQLSIDNAKPNAVSKKSPCSARVRPRKRSRSRERSWPSASTASALSFATRPAL